MDKRFVLSAAGFAGAAVAAPALAQDANLTLHLDYWAGEYGISAVSDNGAAFSGFVSNSSLALFSSGSVVAGASLTLWNPLASSPYTSGYDYSISLTNATGNWDVTLTDTYGDGWSWANVTGLDAFVATDLQNSETYTIGFASGSSATGNFVVTPAPGALALLGLAGLAGRRKRA